MDLNCDRCELLGYRWLNRNIGPSYHGLCVGLTHHWNKELPHLNNREGGGDVNRQMRRIGTVDALEVSFN